jgi:hypothetical protein
MRSGLSPSLSVVREREHFLALGNWEVRLRMREVGRNRSESITDC